MKEEDVRKAAREFIALYPNCYELWQQAHENYLKKWRKKSEAAQLRALEILEEEWTPLHAAHLNVLETDGSDIEEKACCLETLRADVPRAWTVFDGKLISSGSGMENPRIRRYLESLPWCLKRPEIDAFGSQLDDELS